jgi:ferredoxin
MLLKSELVRLSIVGGLLQNSLSTHLLTNIISFISILHNTRLLCTCVHVRAFSISDDKLGKVKDAGLSSGPNYNENVSVDGKQVPGAVVGQKLTVVAAKVRVKIPVNCQAGDCGTCMVKLNGRKVKGKKRFFIIICACLYDSMHIRACV